MSSNLPQSDKPQISSANKTELPVAVHALIAGLVFVVATYLFSGRSALDIPAMLTALAVILGGNSLGHVFAHLKKRELKMLDRLLGTFSLYGLSLLTVYYVLN